MNLWRFQGSGQQAEAKFGLMGTQGRGAQPSGGAPHAARLAFGEAPIFKAPRGVFHLNDKQKALPGVPEQEVYFGPTQTAVLDQEAETL